MCMIKIFLIILKRLLISGENLTPRITLFFAFTKKMIKYAKEGK